MAHLSVENVLIFLRHCYVEVFDFSLPLSHSSSFFSISISPSLFLSPSFPSFLLRDVVVVEVVGVAAGVWGGILLQCNSLFECI